MQPDYIPKHPKFQDISGQKFGRLKALRPASKRGTHVLWLCLCDCGKETYAVCWTLRSGKKASCGCLHDEIRRRKGINATHGMSHTKVYSVWCAMRKRCTNPNAANYGDYGGKGIAVCERWNDFGSFLEDMGEPPTPGHSLDRIDNAKGYSPDNCRWATSVMQANNKTTTIIVTYDGVSQTLREWSQQTGISHSLLRKRRSAGWPVDKMLTLPSRTKKSELQPMNRTP